MWAGEKCYKTIKLFFAGDYKFGSPQKGAFDFRHGEGADRFTGGLGKCRSAVGRGF